MFGLEYELDYDVITVVREVRKEKAPVGKRGAES